MTSTLRILVIDDDPLQLELVERALSRDGFEVRGVSTTAALAAEAAQHQPHVVLIDVNMPDAPAAETIAVARRAATGCRVILYSAWEEARLRSLATSLGADGYISKSESVIAIGRRLRELFRGGP